MWNRVKCVNINLSSTQEECFEPISTVFSTHKFKTGPLWFEQHFFEHATAAVKQHSVEKVLHSITRGIVISMSWLQSSCINHYLALVMLWACLNLAEHGLAMSSYRGELWWVAIADSHAAASVWRYSAVKLTQIRMVDTFAVAVLEKTRVNRSIGSCITQRLVGKAGQKRVPSADNDSLTFDRSVCFVRKCDRFSSLLHVV